MASTYWIKLYHEILDDPKMGRLDDALFRRAVECFLAAGDLGCDGALPPTSDLAWRLRVDERDLAQQLSALADAGILSKDGNGNWLVTNFHKRQKPASGRERVQRYRARERLMVTESDAQRNETVSDRYTDIEKETDAEVNQRDKQKDSATSGNLKEPLSNTFIVETGIPLHTGGKEKWKAALQRMQDAGVQVEDLRGALRACYRKGLTIATLGSVANPAIIEMAARKGKKGARDRPEDNYRRFLEGPYGRIGVD